MATPIRFCRGMLYNHGRGSVSVSMMIKMLYEFWGYCVNGTNALQVPGGMANTMSISYSISNTTGAGVSPIVVTTTSTHALATAQQVTISGVNGCTAANGTYQITVISSTTFSLNGTTGNGGYTSGGTVNTTPHAYPVNFTEGTPVLAVGNDGYTAAQVSTTAFGDAIFQATTNQPFTSVASSLTVNQATNYQTTIAGGSNGQSLPQSTINVASTTTASTTIASGSTGVSLPTGTINVASATAFPSGGYLQVQTTEGIQLVTYTGTTGTTFTGCSGGIGSMTTGGTVTIGFPANGTINVVTNAGTQTVTYTGITGTTFTGCSGGSGLMTTGNAVWAPIQLTTSSANVYPNLGSVVVSGMLGNTSANGTWVVTTPTYNINNALFYGAQVAFPSNNAALPQATITATTAAPFCTTTGVQTLPTATINVSATAPASTAITASSNNVALPTGTLNVTSTTGFPTSGTLNVQSTVVTSVALGSNNVTLPNATINAASTSGFPTTGGTIQVGINSISTTTTGVQALPTGTINVTSTTGFPSAGFLFITTSTGVQLVQYTGGGGGGTTFTGCTGGGGNTSNGGLVVGAQAVTYTGTTPTSFIGCSGGTGTMITGASIGGGPFNQTVTYTNLTGTTFTGCTGGVGTMFTGNTVNNTGFFTSFPSGGGQIYINTTTGAQLVSYAGVTATSFTGCSGGNGNTSAGGSVFTAFSPASNYSSTTGSQTMPGVVTPATINVASTVSASTTIAAASNGLTLPQSTINAASVTGFPATGVIYVTTSGGVQVVNYTGVNGTAAGGFTFTGCSGGSGTMSTGGAITAGFPSSGFAYALTTSGYQVFSYAGTTGTSFTGCLGGSTTASLPAGSPVFVGFPPAGTMNVTTATGGTAIVTYTGTTANTFTGGSGGSGTMVTGNPIQSPITVITTTPTTLLYNHSVVTSNIGGLPNANSTFLVTPITPNILHMNGAFGLGAYTSGGTLVDHQNFYLNTSTPNGNWTSGGTQLATTTNMTGKLLVIWKPGSQSSEDAMYIINSVIGNNQLKISLNTGGTPDPVTLHPSFNQRSNINYRVVDAGAAGYDSGIANQNYITLQFNPGAIGLNAGQANSQVQVSHGGGGSIQMNMSPGGNWNGITFPVTGNYHIDATGAFSSLSGGYFNGSGSSGTLAITMAADPGLWWMHLKDTSNSDGTSYLHCEIPTRLYSSSADTNPMIALSRGGTFNGTVFGISNSAGSNFGRGFAMKGTDGVLRNYYSLAKSLSGDASPIFGTALTDFRLAFNTNKGFILASDIVLTLPSVNNQFSLGRIKCRSIKLTSTPLPLYHRFGTPGGTQWLNVQNGIAIMWDNTILPSNLFFQI